MDEMLRADLDAPRKQRHTAHRIWERLVDEHGATIAYRTVSKYVAVRRRQILLEARHRASVVDGFVPQTHLPGQDAEVDFADRRGAELLFQVFTEREERSSIAIASNSAFSEWARTFTDPRLCAAIVDRLTFDDSIIETGTESFRLRTTKRRSTPRAS